MKLIDMHTHTTASDGYFSPSRLVDYAVSKHLNGISITDHDSVSGIEEALKHAVKYDNFLILPGLELSTEYQKEEIHILGYSIDYHSDELLSILHNMQQQRKVRAEKMVSKLNQIGFHITLEEVYQQAQGGNIGRSHLAQILIQKGYADSMNTAFAKYLGKGCPAFVPRFKLTPKEAIELIKSIEGYAVLAHPGLLKNKSIVYEIIEMGIDGLEVYHPEHNQEDIQKFFQIAQQHRLTITGGSDFHDIPSKYCHNADLGTCKIPIEHISQFINHK